jgi:hypothetical protein
MRMRLRTRRRPARAVAWTAALIVAFTPGLATADLIVTVLNNTPVPRLIEGDTLDISFSVRNTGAQAFLYDGKNVDRGRFIGGDPEDRLDIRNSRITDVTTPATIAAGQTRTYTYRFRAAETVREDGPEGTYLYSILIFGRDALTDDRILSNVEPFGATVRDRPVPEPSALGLVASAGVVGLGIGWRRRTRRAR